MSGALDLSGSKKGGGGVASGGGASTAVGGGNVAPAAHAKDPSPPPRHSKPGDLHIIGHQQHDTVIYHGDDVIPSKVGLADEDDSFYEVLEVTLDDAKSMFKDLQRARANLEDAPLRGKKLRDLEKETATLKNLHDHPNTAIRIRFPDRIVLQGIFRTSDTIGSVKTWLREYLHDSTLEFYLFTAPPKKVLQDETKLVDEGLVAMVVIYFGSQNMPENNKVLKPAFYNQLSDPEKAFDLAKNKLKVRKRESESDDGVIKPSTETQAKDHSQDPSTSRSQQPVKRSADKGAVPKWFKMK